MALVKMSKGTYTLLKNVASPLALGNTALPSLPPLSRPSLRLPFLRASPRVLILIAVLVVILAAIAVTGVCVLVVILVHLVLIPGPFLIVIVAASLCSVGHPSLRARGIGVALAAQYLVIVILMPEISLFGATLFTHRFQPKHHGVAEAGQSLHRRSAASSLGCCCCC